MRRNEGKAGAGKFSFFLGTDATKGRLEGRRTGGGIKEDNKLTRLLSLIIYLS